VKIRERAEQRFSGLLEFAPDGILAVDAQGRILLANRQAGDLFGYAADELAGMSVESLIPERFRGGHVQHRGDYARQPRVRPMGLGRDLSGRRKDGSEFAAEISLSSVPLEDGVVVIVTVRDVTDRRRAEQALRERERQIERLREEYVGFVSHDIRNPVSTISLHAELLLRTLEPKGLTESAESARIIGESAARISAMIRELLDVSRLESGQPELHLEATAIGDLVTRVVDRTLSAAERARIHVGRSTAAPVVCDAHRIERVVVNLLTNAIKYSPAGASIEIAIEDAGDEVRVAIGDHGPGVAPEDRERIFEKYERTRSHQGKDSLGLGLFISRLIVQAHGGRIWVESTVGEGSTFVFALPRGLAAPAAAPEGAAPERTSAAGQRLLVVDDEVAACAALARLLGEEGYLVETAHSGAEALALLPTFRPDLALLDVTMPTMTGVELMQHLREVIPDLRVVFMTGHERDSAQLRAAAQAGYVSKPIDLDLLLGEIAKLL
jgi:PAS domain S-box-containing protein